METILSTQNSKVKEWYKLCNKKGREKQHAYLIEGAKLIEEAFLYNQIIEAVLIEEGMDVSYEFMHLIRNANVPIYYVSNIVIRKLSDIETPQGIIAVVKRQIHTIENFLLRKNRSLLLLDEIQDPGNLGTIIRSADSAGIGGVILGKGTVELYNPKVLRATMGSIYHFPIIEENLNELIPKLKANHIKIIGTSPYANSNYYDLDLKDDIAILVGNEGKGLSATRMEQADFMVKIPILGKAESLNVAMATTIVLFERVRQMNGRL